jgi:hypothetical protein
LEGTDAGDMNVGTVNAFQTVSSGGQGSVSLGQSTMLTITLGERSREYMVTIRGQAEFDSPGQIQLRQTAPTAVTLKTNNVANQAIGIVEAAVSIPANTAVTIQLRALQSTEESLVNGGISINLPDWARPSAVVERKFA